MYSTTLFSMSPKTSSKMSSVMSMNTLNTTDVAAIIGEATLQTMVATQTLLVA